MFIKGVKICVYIIEFYINCTVSKYVHGGDCSLYPCQRTEEYGENVDPVGRMVWEFKELARAVALHGPL